jgi:hypothetical protein
MSETANLRLPLVQAAQAQKHVTVNEALWRLDAVSQLVLASRTLADAPLSPPAGATYAIPTGAGGAWAGQEGRIALAVNGGWEFIEPHAGWRGWIEDEGLTAIHDGGGWAAGAAAVSPSGAGLAFRVVEHDHPVSTGSVSVTPPLLPADSIVFGLTGRVLLDLGGTAASFRIGIGGESPDRYGSGIGTQAGSWFRGVTGTPLAYYSDTALTITGEGGGFAGGLVRIAVHLAELGLPRP